MEVKTKARSHLRAIDGGGILNHKTVSGSSPTNRAIPKVEIGLGVGTQVVFVYGNSNDKNMQNRICIDIKNSVLLTLCFDFTLIR